MDGRTMQRDDRCDWTESVSYFGLLTEYCGLVRSMINHVDHEQCVDLPVIPKYSWSEIVFVLVSTLLMAHVRYKSLLYLIRVVTEKIQGLPRHASYKIAIYSIKLLETSAFVVTLSYLLHWQDKCSAISNLHLFNDPPSDNVPLEVANLLAIARTLSHLHDLLVSQKYDKRKDDKLMVLHHAVTVILLITARNNILIGMWVLLLHDTCDPIIDICKIAQSTIEHLPATSSRRRCTLSLLSKMQDVFCLLLIVVWIVCRLFLFPNRVIHATIVSTSSKCRYSIGFTCSTLFLILMAMHIMWFYLIIKFVVIRLLYGQRKDTTDPEDGQTVPCPSADKPHSQ